MFSNNPEQLEFHTSQNKLKDEILTIPTNLDTYLFSSTLIPFQEWKDS